MSFFTPRNIGVEKRQRNQGDEVEGCAALSLSPVQMLEVEKASSLPVVIEIRRGSSRPLDLGEFDIVCLRGHLKDKRRTWLSGDIMTAISAHINNRSMKFTVESARKVRKPSGKSDCFPEITSPNSHFQLSFLPIPLLL